MTNYRKYRDSYRLKKDRKNVPISWSEYNINCFDVKIDTANKITDNASISTTEIYTHIDTKQKKKILNKYNYRNKIEVNKNQK